MARWNRPPLNAGHEVVGIYGYGGSADITAQIALNQGACFYVTARSAETCALAATLVPLFSSWANQPLPGEGTTGTSPPAVLSMTSR
ncbi:MULTISPECIES: hypothetical protein [Arthrobacter]|uniref:hypothetical protein n=1 Tax=Arthrobacter TaxID=1663 RepID=UPI0012B5B62F|nr:MULTISPECIES: hypothetical protein [Arthrobacter]